LTVSQAAERLNISEYAVRVELQAGRLLCVRLGAKERNIRIPNGALEVWIAENTKAWRSFEEVAYG
jgi:excisionase family DNA binding protein